MYRTYPHPLEVDSGRILERSRTAVEELSASVPTSKKKKGEVQCVVHRAIHRVKSIMDKNAGE